MTSSDGRLKDKAAEMADFRPTPGLRMVYFRTSGLGIELYPETAIVTGLAEWAFSFNGAETSIRRRYTATYLRGGSMGWQLVALHMGSALPEGHPG